jgi:hypothetical protein
MLLPTGLVILALIVIALAAIWFAKKRVVDHEKPRGDLRPNDRRPTAHVDVS